MSTERRPADPDFGQLPEVVSVQFAQDPSATGVARSLVRTALTEQPASVRDMAVLLCDELVANAVQHGRGAIGLRLQVTPGQLRVEVSDEDDAGLLVGSPSVDDEHGRGLLIVDSLASSWGVEGRESGKVVWFQLDIDPAGEDT